MSAGKALPAGRLRLLALHSFRTSAKTFQEQVIYDCQCSDRVIKPSIASCTIYTASRSESKMKLLHIIGEVFASVIEDACFTGQTIWLRQKAWASHRACEILRLQPPPSSAQTVPHGVLLQDLLSTSMNAYIPHRTHADLEFCRSIWMPRMQRQDPHQEMLPLSLTLHTENGGMLNR